MLFFLSLISLFFYYDLDRDPSDIYDIAEVGGGGGGTVEYKTPLNYQPSVLTNNNVTELTPAESKTDESVTVVPPLERVYYENQTFVELNTEKDEVYEGEEEDDEENDEASGNGTSGKEV